MKASVCCKDAEGNMDLELSSDQINLRDNIREVLEGISSPETVRAIYEGTSTSEPVWNQMVELYWPAMSVPEESEGLGLSFVEVALLCEELGRATTPGPLLATASQLIPALTEAKATTQLAQVAAGDLTGALAISEAGRWQPQQPQTVAVSNGNGWQVSGTKTDVVSGSEVGSFVVVAPTHDQQGAGLFLVQAQDAEVSPTESIEPTLALADVTFHNASATLLLEPGAATTKAIDRITQQAVVAMAIHTVGACRRIFEVTLEYAKVREQYGQLIGSFQALKHRLADMYLAVERANAVAYYASVAIAEDDNARAMATHTAKIAAGDCQRLLAQDGLQLHGGIGFTWENDLHFLLKRAKAGELLCGSSRYHRNQLAQVLGLTEAPNRGGVQ